MKARQQRTYIVVVPVNSQQGVLVRAESKADAIRKAKAGEGAYVLPASGYKPWTAWEDKERP